MMRRKRRRLACSADTWTRATYPPATGSHASCAAVTGAGSENTSPVVCMPRTGVARSIWMAGRVRSNAWPPLPKNAAVALTLPLRPTIGWYCIGSARSA